MDHIHHRNADRRLCRADRHASTSLSASLTRVAQRTQSPISRSIGHTKPRFTCVSRHGIWITSTLLPVTALVGVTAHAMTGGSIEAQLRGTWVPASAACPSPLKRVTKATRVTCVNGAQRAEYRPLEQCFTCMRRDVTHGTMLSTDAMGDSPCMISLDTSKKQAAVGIDCSNDKQLRARFPFGTAALAAYP